MMGSMLGDLPSFDPHNFSQLRPSDPSNPSKVVPTTYCPTHSRTSPPPDQGSNHNKLLRPKRAATEHPTPEHGCKQPRASTT
ncbi:hypothetical protein ES319_A02G114000v1 [Gossypium barbadense]|uniref:DET1- and DDB1-associated protein 1 domain-containing protein n=2 Tax=Gossypium TaxID=3633 RepID=A0A5J5WR84_GOSBA|nr:hypothetical protein ES319_A02G114000v1 [Gossypium barbadense]TYH28186.1 hypothetical protein ES288_A02G125100v1 [Gossypium darwinii]